jgi:hypothetical protein
VTSLRRLRRRVAAYRRYAAKTWQNPRLPRWRQLPPRAGARAVQAYDRELNRTRPVVLPCPDCRSRDCGCPPDEGLLL